jgi:hypothetical protein
MMAAERGEWGRGCSGGELEPICGSGGGGAESGSARESERLQAEPCTKMCVRLHYHLIE